MGTRYKISLLPNEPHICLDGHVVERVNSYKCLGVQVDETLLWEAHIFKVVSKVVIYVSFLFYLFRQTLADTTDMTI